jgi:hypothetical protein
MKISDVYLGDYGCSPPRPQGFQVCFSYATAALQPRSAEMLPRSSTAFLPSSQGLVSASIPSSRKMRFWLVSCPRYTYRVYCTLGRDVAEFVQVYMSATNSHTVSWKRRSTWRWGGSRGKRNIDFSLYTAKMYSRYLPMPTGIAAVDFCRLSGESQAAKLGELG